MKFKRVCPKIAEECVGEGCVAFNVFIEEIYFYDKENKTTINYVSLDYNKKKTNKKYTIVWRHYNRKETHKTYECAEYPLLRKGEKHEELVDLEEFFHGHERSKYEDRRGFHSDRPPDYQSNVRPELDATINHQIINEVP